MLHEILRNKTEGSFAPKVNFDLDILSDMNTCTIILTWRAACVLDCMQTKIPSVYVKYLLVFMHLSS